jgi:hypothetical protein
LSAGLGAGLATVSALGGVWLMAWAMPRSHNVLLGAVVGTILARMVLFCSAVALLALGTHLPPPAFVGGLFTYYAIFQALEIRAFHRGARTGLNPGR